MTEMWNPYSLKGEKPFKHFDTWNDFIEHYAVPKNEIVRKGGPGDAIQAGEWYLTLMPMKSWGLSFVMTEADEHKIYADAYEGSPIKYWHAGGVSPRFLKEWPKGFYTTKWPDGSKNSWGNSKYHYKVDIEDIFNFDFLNWINENPLEVK